LDRVKDVKKLYQILARLEKKLGGKLSIDECIKDKNLPEKGLYFCFEEGEKRSTSGGGLRVVRIGAHALMPSSRSTMLNRLKLDRGNDKDLGGKHRRSMLRKHIGRSFMQRDKIACKTWEKRVKPGPRENAIEEKISKHIRGKMKFLYLEVDGDPSSWRKRKEFERYLIALLSNYGRENAVDPPSKKWLGRHFPDRITERVSEAGLYNVHDVERDYDPAFLKDFEKYVTKMKARKK
jgi:hypothetical protein